MRHALYPTYGTRDEGTSFFVSDTYLMMVDLANRNKLQTNVLDWYGCIWSDN